MQERNFEKQVRNKMEELSITPSGPVWQKVEAEIKRKKDKRRIIFWLLPLLATCLFFGWWLWPLHNEMTKPETAIGKPHATHETTTSIENTTAQPLQTTVPSNQQTDKKIDVTNKITTAPRDSKPSKLIAAREEPYTTLPNTIANNHHPQPTDDMAFAETEKPIADHTIAMEAKAVVNMPVAIIRIPTTDSILQLKSYHPIGADNASPILTINKVAKKWQWSIYGAMGVSGISDDLLDAFALNKSADAMLPLYASAPSYYSSYPIVQIRPSTPSPVTKGLSFSAGIDVKKAIGKKTHIATGVHYAYYSTQIEVGQKISNPAFNSANLLDAATGYRNTSQRYPYTNQYHFIEVPVSVYYSLLKRKPLYIHTGISMAQLLSSNALYYNASSNAYYQNKYHLNKTQLNWQAGFSYGFNMGKHISLSAGPQIQYGLRTLQKTATTNKPHLFAAGVHLNISVK